MNVAAILERVGFVPIVPTVPEPLGTTPAFAAQRVPTVPSVPTAKSNGVNEAEHAPPAAAVTHTACEVELAVSSRLGVADEAMPDYPEISDDNTVRRAGKVPTSDAAPIHCIRCGPVWAHPSVAAALPMVDGWPRALGCPWCLVRKAGGYIPRPRVSCERCGHFTADPVNPAAGMGTCKKGPAPHYPMALHICADLTTQAKVSE